MLRNTRWFVVLAVTVVALGLLFGTALADPGYGSEGYGCHMHERMDPELYAQMIQHMTEVHGAEVTAEMLQRMNEGGTCHGVGQGPIGSGMMNGRYGNSGMMGQSFGTSVGGFMHGLRGIMEGFSNGRMMNGGMMVR